MTPIETVIFIGQESCQTFECSISARNFSAISCICHGKVSRSNVTNSSPPQRMFTSVSRKLECKVSPTITGIMLSGLTRSVSN